MLYVGLDIHTKHISICVLNETGQLVRRSHVRLIDQMMQILEGLPDRFEVCYEASCGYGHFHDLLRPLAVRVIVAHPGQLRLIYRSQVIAKRTRAKNTIRSLLRGAGETPPRNPGLWTKKGIAWLRQLELPTFSQQLRRDLLLEEIETLNDNCGESSRS